MLHTEACCGQWSGDWASPCCCIAWSSVGSTRVGWRWCPSAGCGCWAWGLAPRGLQGGVSGCLVGAQLLDGSSEYGLSSCWHFCKPASTNTAPWKQYMDCPTFLLKATNNFILRKWGENTDVAKGRKKILTNLLKNSMDYLQIRIKSKIIQIMPSISLQVCAYN